VSRDKNIQYKKLNLNRNQQSSVRTAHVLHKTAQFQYSLSSYPPDSHGLYLYSSFGIGRSSRFAFRVRIHTYLLTLQYKQAATVMIAMGRIAARRIVIVHSYSPGGATVYSCQIMISWAQSSLAVFKLHLGRFSRFAGLASVINRQTDRPPF